MTTEKITSTLAELLKTFGDKGLPDYAVIIAGNEHKVTETWTGDKEGFWKLTLADPFKGKTSINAEAVKVKVSYEPPKVEQPKPAKTNKPEKQQPPKEVEQPKPAAKDLTSDFLINSELIDRLVSNNDAEMLGKIAKLQAEFLKLQKDLCDRLMATTDNTPKQETPTPKQPKTANTANTASGTTDRSPTFNEKLDALKKAYHYIETAKASGKKVSDATLEAKAKFYWANGEVVATGKDRFNNMINGYRFTKELYGDRKGDMHRILIDGGLTFNEWYKHCTEAALKPKAEKVFFSN